MAVATTMLKVRKVLDGPADHPFVLPCSSPPGKQVSKVSRKSQSHLSLGSMAFSLPSFYVIENPFPSSPFPTTLFLKVGGGADCMMKEIEVESVLAFRTQYLFHSCREKIGQCQARVCH